MVRRYRVETYSGELLTIEVEEDKKDYLKIRLVGTHGELKLRIKDIKDNVAIVEIDKDIYRVKLHEDTLFVNDENSLVSRIVELLPLGLSHYHEATKKGAVRIQKGEIRAPISGKINKINVKVGDKVSIGDVLLLMESMKMITEVKSDVEGIVEEILVRPGDAVNRNTLLIKIKPLEDKKEK